ncbi:MAG TPA: peptide chain release factor-like protein [Ktedonobacterales bacterium]|nr:peptide chain release factor-like protein [Ktedonobacterales bacterium]
MGDNQNTEYREEPDSKKQSSGVTLKVGPRYPTDRASLERDCDVTYFVASGPGGQHRNKVETGVRLIHRSTGITVTATERRSQYANREAAYARMAARLEQAQRPAPKPRKPTRPSVAVRERRLEAKRHTSAIKRLRATPTE